MLDFIETYRGPRGSVSGIDTQPPRCPLCGEILFSIQARRGPVWRCGCDAVPVVAKSAEQPSRVLQPTRPRSLVQQLLDAPGEDEE